jgi:hypothetical protein
MVMRRNPTYDALHGQIGSLEVDLFAAALDQRTASLRASSIRAKIHRATVLRMLTLPEQGELDTRLTLVLERR